MKAIIKTTLLTLAILLGLSNSLHGQVVTPIDSIEYAGVDGSDLNSIDHRVADVMLKDPKGNLTTIRVNHLKKRIEVRNYDGSTWVDLPSIHLKEVPRRGDTINLNGIYYKNELYVSGLFGWDSSGTINYNSVARLKDNKWVDIGTSKLNVQSHRDSIKKAWRHWIHMSVFDTTLLISGLFDSLGTSPTDRCVAWDGNKLNPINLPSVVVDEIHYVGGIKDSLFLFTHNNTTNEDTILVFHNKSLIKRIPNDGWYRGLLKNNGKRIYGYLTRYSPYKKHVTIMTNNSFRSTLVKDNGLWLSEVNVLDRAIWFLSNDGINRHMNGQTSTLSTSLPVFTLDKMKVIGSKIYITTREDLGGHKWKSRLHEIDIDQTATIVGRCYLDLDDDCEFGPGDIPIHNRILSDTTNFNNAITDREGLFSMIVLAREDYTIETFKQIHASASCGGDKVRITNAKKDSTYKIQFPYKPKRTFDLQATLNGGSAIRGRWHSLSIRVQNNSAYYVSDTTYAQVIFDRRITKIDNPNHARSGDTVTFKIAPLKQLQDTQILIRLLLNPVKIVKGDTIRYYLDLMLKDSFPANNKDTLIRKVRSPFDPNFKESMPEGEIYKPVKQIEYTIHFQNVGSASAKKVTVIDTIDPRLPLRYIRVKGTSHRQFYDLHVRNNILTWTFNNIYLPDSATDPEGSKGYINYEAAVVKGFSNVGDQIDNKAFIYFDYEDPIETNIASVSLGDELGIQPDVVSKNGLLVYPNPFSSLISVKNYQVQSDIVTLFDNQGKQIRSAQIAGGKTIDISTEHLASGVYFLRSVNGFTSKIIKY
ncbi:MAG: T9SS type A sorting domain-containing protein [Bacteroidia bacterium]|nr:T9SS type A sorting domain-containing protein [Bacteroidia bacterium]